MVGVDRSWAWACAGQGGVVRQAFRCLASALVLFPFGGLFLDNPRGRAVQGLVLPLPPPQQHWRKLAGWEMWQRYWRFSTSTVRR